MLWNTENSLAVQELVLLRHLNFDRNLVQFYGACFAENNMLLVFELMDGGDLREALGDDSEGRLGWYQQGGPVLCDVARVSFMKYQRLKGWRLQMVSRGRLMHADR